MKKVKNLKVIHHNIRSYRNNINSLEYFLNNSGTKLLRGKNPKTHFNKTRQSRYRTETFLGFKTKNFQFFFNFGL